MFLFAVDAAASIVAVVAGVAACSTNIKSLIASAGHNRNPAHLLPQLALST